VNSALAIYSICAADSGVIALLNAGTSPPSIRFYDAGNVPQDNTSGASMPCATFQSIAGSPTIVFDLHAPADNERVQVDAWSLNSLAEAQSISDAIRTALENQDAQIAQEITACVVSLNGHDYEPDTKRYRVSIDFSFWIPH